jgi:hypothetical protein
MYLILGMVIGLFSCIAIYAAPADLPETGQISCWDNAGVLVACTGTGQDGDLKSGVAWPASRFVVGTGTEADCVTDKLTGLMWLRVVHITNPDMQNAILASKHLTTCGHEDWRLPNIVELESLVNSQVASPADYLNAHGFDIATPVDHPLFWSSTSSPSAPNSAFVVNLQTGNVGFENKVVTFSNSLYRFSVRGGH